MEGNRNVAMIRASNSNVAVRGENARRRSNGGGRGRGRGRRNTNRPDLFSGPGFNVQRGPRMPRSRRASLDSLAFPAAHVPATPPARANVTHDLSKLTYLFKKQLQNSDVSYLRRMVLPKRDAEAYLPMLDTKDGIQISMHDMNGNHEWRFKYRLIWLHDFHHASYKFWPNNSSRMYVLESTGDFVNAHDLVPGDYILVYQNFEDGKYVIEAMKEYEFEEPPAPACNINKDPVINEPAANPETDLEFPDLPELPDMETFFAYDTNYLDDSPLEYRGDIINFPRMESYLAFDVNYTDRLL